MKLGRIEDIAGCRAVMSDLDEVLALVQSLIKSRTSNLKHRVRDYIFANPKSSGYRGMHIVYKYQGTKAEFRNLSVELQIRTKLQHSWATAVEVVGTFTGQL